MYGLTRLLLALPFLVLYELSALSTQLSSIFGLTSQLILVSRFFGDWLRILRGLAPDFTAVSRGSILPKTFNQGRIGQSINPHRVVWGTPSTALKNALE